MRFSLLTLFFFFFVSAQAQIQEALPVPTQGGQMHQLYLDKPVNKVIKVEYLDGTEIKHELGKDGETLYLLNYQKRGRVKVITEDTSGNQTELFRSPCFIDPVIPT